VPWRRQEDGDKTKGSTDRISGMSHNLIQNAVLRRYRFDSVTEGGERGDTIEEKGVKHVISDSNPMLLRYTRVNQAILYRSS
jgi:hypothetical protein